MRMTTMAAFVLGLMVLPVPSPGAVVSPRQLVEVVDVSAPTVSPDGRLVAFRLEQASVQRNTVDTVWYVQAVAGDFPPQRVGEGGVPLRDTAGIPLQPDVAWSPDGRWVYYRARLHGRTDVWRAATDGSGAEQVTNDPADIRDFSLDAAGRLLKYSVGATREQVAIAEQAEYDSGIRIDQTTPVGQGLFRSGYIGERLATQRLGKVWFERVPLLDDAPVDWKVVDLATGMQRSATPAEVPSGKSTESALLEGLAPPWKSVADADGRRLALLTRVGEAPGLRDKPDIQLSVVSGDRRARRVDCSVPLCTRKAITGIQWRPQSDEVLFTIAEPEEGLAQSIFGWDLGTGTVRQVVRSGGLVNGGRNESSMCGVSSVVLVCVTAEPDQPPMLERIDLETGARGVLFDPNAALALAIREHVQVRLLRWSDRHGQVFTGQYYLAQGGEGMAAPLFVTYYRCPGFVRGGYGDEWPLASLAGHGISALCINQVRGYRLDAVERYGQGLSAVRSVVDLLSQSGEIDATKVGMGGLSFGTEVTMWTAMNSKLLTAASMSSPVLSPTYYLAGSMKGDAFFSILKDLWQVEAPDSTTERWQTLSPALNLDRVCVPMLMQIPEQEYLFSLDYAIPLIHKRRLDLYAFPNEPHQKFQPRHKLAVYERNLDWFRFWLQNYRQPGIAKSEQYAYWEAMKSERAGEAGCPGDESDNQG